MKLSDLIANASRPFTGERRWLRKAALPAAVIGATVLTSASLFATGPDAGPTPVAEKAWPVTVQIARSSALQPSVSAFGRLEANRTAHLRCDLVARVDQVAVREGDWANEGDLLVRLDQAEVQLDLAQRQADLKQHQAQLASLQLQQQVEQGNARHFEARHQAAQAKLRRHTDLLEKRLISSALYDEVVSQAGQASIEYEQHRQTLQNLPNLIAVGEAQVAKARALVARAELDLAKTEIRAPFSGPVLAVHVAPGDHSNLSAPLVDLAQAESFEVRVQVPDGYLEQFNAAAPGTITAISEQGAALTLGRLAGHVRAGQTGLDAFFTLDEPDAHAQALGGIMHLSIRLPEQTDVIALPVQSIYENNRVYTVKDSRLVGHEVERIGETESAAGDYRVLIRSAAIADGDALVATQLPRAINGLLVEVANPPSRDS